MVPAPRRRPSPGLRHVAGRLGRAESGGARPGGGGGGGLRGGEGGAARPALGGGQRPRGAPARPGPRPRGSSRRARPEPVLSEGSVGWPAAQTRLVSRGVSSRAGALSTLPSLRGRGGGCAVSGLGGGRRGSRLFPPGRRQGDCSSEPSCPSSLSVVAFQPAYQNLRQRVDNFVSNHLATHTWSPHLNKNQLRNNIRQQVLK